MYQLSTYGIITVIKFELSSIRLLQRHYTGYCLPLAVHDICWCWHHRDLYCIWRGPYHLWRRLTYVLHHVTWMKFVGLESTRTWSISLVIKAMKTFVHQSLIKTGSTSKTKRCPTKYIQSHAWPGQKAVFKQPSCCTGSWQYTAGLQIQF